MEHDIVVLKQYIISNFSTTLVGTMINGFIQKDCKYVRCYSIAFTISNSNGTRHFQIISLTKTKKKTMKALAKVLALFVLVISVRAQIFKILNKGISDPTAVLSRGPDQQLCGLYTPLTGAANCELKELENWTCFFCRQADALGYKYAGSVYKPIVGTFCYFAVNGGRKEIVLVCRGSWNLPNFILDALMQQVPPDCSGKAQKKWFTRRIGRAIGNNKEAKVHLGFRIATCSIYAEALAKLRELLKQNPGFSVGFTGTDINGKFGNLSSYILILRIGLSLGAAMANLAGYYVISDGTINPAGYSVCTFGEPRVGNRAYADWWNGQSGVSATRVVNNADPVPHIPASWKGYVHHGSELWWNGKTNVSCSKAVYEDPNCGNSKGPIYDVLDHINIWGTNFGECLFANPLPLLKQLIIPFSA